MSSRLDLAAGKDDSARRFPRVGMSRRMVRSRYHSTGRQVRSLAAQFEVTMFKLPNNQNERISQALAGRVCTIDRDTYISRSFGRAKNGLPPKYFVHVGEKSFAIRAWTDQEAIDLANQKINR